MLVYLERDIAQLIAPDIYYGTFVYGKIVFVEKSEYPKIVIEIKIRP